MNRKVIIALIAIFSILSYLCCETVLSPKWWKSATLKDVQERFIYYNGAAGDARISFNNVDEHGRTLLHLACLYSRDPVIPTYFVWQGTDLYIQDHFGYIASDYAAKNPYLKDFAEKLKYLERSDYYGRLDYLRSHGARIDIDLILSNEAVD